MNDVDRWQRIKELFDSALSYDAALRGPFLDEACAGDESLRAEVDGMLAAHGDARRFFDRPAGLIAQASGLGSPKKTPAHEMDADRWRLISRLYYEALAHPDDQRKAFLDVRCQGEDGLSEEVASLLEQDSCAARVLDRASNAAHPGLVPGAQVGNYRIERRLGSGGLGVVFLAHDTTLHRQVALKVLQSPADGKRSRAQLLREARSAAALSHPNICTVYEVGEANGCAFIAMEYVDGRSVSDLLAECALPMKDAVRYGIDAADALAYAHDHGVIHRDLKAANAIITADRLKLVDFGLARRDDALLGDARALSSLAPAGVAAGTPYAMAPEQVRGGGTDARTDIWALGVLLYEMVSCARPFCAAAIPEMFSAILNDAPRPLPATVPVETRALIERCLEKNPDRRYQDASQVRAALQAIHSNHVSSWIAWRYYIRQRRGWVAIVALLAVAALLVGLSVGGVLPWFRGGAPVAAPIKLAVLPFGNLTGDPNQEYFSDGLTEEMIAQLGRLQPDRLGVIARTSAMQYKNTKTPVAEIGRQLGVDYVLEGGVRREGSRVGISAQLIRVRDQLQIWADSTERDSSSILTVQSEVARGIAGSLALTLLPAEQDRLSTPRPVNVEAYEAYLKGQEHVYKVTAADLDAALRYFELALEKDPNYALPHTGIAAVWSNRQQFGFAPALTAAPQIRTAIERALALDGHLAEAHYRLAVLKFSTDWDWTGSEREFQVAIDLSPNLLDAHRTYSHLLMILKRPTEALAQAEQALQLDPLNTLSRAFYGTILNHLHRYDDAILQFNQALALVPNHALALNGRRQAFFHKGMYKEALEGERSVWAGRNDADMVTALDRGYIEAGYRGAWHRAADTLAARWQTRQAAPRDVWTLYLFAGDREQALAWLERGYQQREPNMIYLATAPIYDTLRNEPRFQDLLRRMKLPS